MTPLVKRMRGEWHVSLCQLEDPGVRVSEADTQRVSDCIPDRVTDHLIVYSLLLIFYFSCDILLLSMDSLLVRDFVSPRLHEIRTNDWDTQHVS